MKHNKKAATLLVSLLLAVCVTAGGTLAFLTDAKGLTNTFTPSHVTTEVIEDPFDGTTKENVTIKNTGNTEAWIRAAVVITWQDEKGNVYGQMPVEGEDYEIAYDLKNGWIKGDDGFYYWTKPVKSVEEAPNNCSTGVLIKSCTVGGTTAVAPPSGYNLNVEIIGSGIQSKPDDAVEEAWGVTVNTASDGTKTISK